MHKPFVRHQRTGSCRRWCAGSTGELGPDGNPVATLQGGCCSLHGFFGTGPYEQIKKEFLESPFAGLNSRGECVHLTYKHGVPSCGIYQDRPDICKNFPEKPVDIEMIPSCSFSFIRHPDPIIPKSKPNPFYAVQHLEEWPLFTLQRHAFTNPDSTWVGLYHTAPVKTVEAMRLMMLELRRLEWKCWHSGLGGWLAIVAKENLRLQGAVVAMEAVPYGEDLQWRYFKRPVTRKPGKSIPTLAEAMASLEAYARTMEYAHARH